MPPPGSRAEQPLGAPPDLPCQARGAGGTAVRMRRRAAISLGGHSVPVVSPAPGWSIRPVPADVEPSAVEHLPHRPFDRRPAGFRVDAGEPTLFVEIEQP